MDAFEKALIEDRPKVDLLLVIGTSLKVSPVSEILSKFSLYVREAMSYRFLQHIYGIPYLRYARQVLSFVQSLHIVSDPNQQDPSSTYQSRCRYLLNTRNHLYLILPRRRSYSWVMQTRSSTISAKSSAGISLKSHHSPAATS